MTPVIAIFARMGLGGRSAKVAAWFALLVALWGLWQAADWINDRKAVREAANRANSEFTQAVNSQTGQADLESRARETAHWETVKTVEELIDAALEKGCIVSDYINSNGAVCLRAGDTISRSAPE